MEKPRKMTPRKLISYLLILCLAPGCTRIHPGDTADLAQWVDPFIGTGGHGHTFPGAAYPFGMIQLSPDTRPKIRDWDGCSGYHISDTLMYGFSHTHLSGTGCDDYCDVLLAPLPDDTEQSVLDHTSTFSHDSETAQPGYYKVFLDKPQAEVELTTGRRACFHHYSFPEGKDAVIALDLKYRDVLKDVHINQEGQCAVSGLRRSTNWNMEQSVYFYIEFNHPFKTFRHDDTVAVMTFDSNDIMARVGISSVSEENAELNLRSEVSDWDFEAMKSATRAAWNAYLSKIDITMDCDPSTRKGQESLRIFYTSLYHTAIHPSLYSDVNGQYRGMDRGIYTAEGFDRYTVFSIWDTFRAEHPLLLMLEPDRVVDFLKTFISIYDEMGRLPIWEISAYDTDCMVGFNSASVIADAFAAGIVPDDIKEKLLEALLVSSEKAEHGLDSYNAYGYVRGEDENETVSRSLEYAYDCWCVAQVARMMGKKDLEEKYLYRSKFWNNLYDPDEGFMRPRFNGQWVKDFTPVKVTSFFTEANSAQYSFFVPHDVASYVELLGGRKAFLDKLDWLFSADGTLTGEFHPDISGMIGQYAHGNEPSHHIAYFYSQLGKPGKTDRMVKKVIGTMYSASLDGICGNEDCGQMSAWYVLSSLGMYRVCPGNPEMTAVKALYPHAVIRPDGNTVLHASQLATRHPSMTEVGCTGFVTSPVFEVDEDVFDDVVTVKVGNVPAGCTAYCDGRPYDGPFTVSKSCTLVCWNEDAAGNRSLPNEMVLQKRDKKYTVKVTGASEQSELLSDGCHGFVNWRCGLWYDHAATDLEAIADLGAQTDIHTVSARFNQDLRQTIWTPREVEVYGAGEDGVFVRLGRRETGIDELDYTPLVEEFSFDVTGRYRYVKMVAKNISKAPAWHPMAGQDARILCDEIDIH